MRRVEIGQELDLGDSIENQDGTSIRPNTRVGHDFEDLGPTPSSTNACDNEAGLKNVIGDCYRMMDS